MKATNFKSMSDIKNQVDRLIVLLNKVAPSSEVVNARKTVIYRIERKLTRKAMNQFIKSTRKPS